MVGALPVLIAAVLLSPLAGAWPPPASEVAPAIPPLWTVTSGCSTPTVYVCIEKPSSVPNPLTSYAADSNFAAVTATDPAGGTALLMIPPARLVPKPAIDPIVWTWAAGSWTNRTSTAGTGSLPAFNNGCATWDPGTSSYVAMLMVYASGAASHYTTWSYTIGAAWSNITTTSGGVVSFAKPVNNLPACSMVWDSVRGELVFVGSALDNPHPPPAGSSETWTLTPSGSWTNATVTASEPAVFDPMLVFDTAHGVTLDVGPWSTGGVQTWSWDGTAWTNVTGSGGHPKNNGGYLYFGTGNSLAYFGGEPTILQGMYAFSTVLSPFVYRWDGTEWIDSTSLGAAFDWYDQTPTWAGPVDANSTTLIVFGGNTSNSVLNATSLWCYQSTGCALGSVAMSVVLTLHPTSLTVPPGGRVNESVDVTNTGGTVLTAITVIDSKAGGMACNGTGSQDLGPGRNFTCLGFYLVPSNYVGAYSNDTVNVTGLYNSGASMLVVSATGVVHIFAPVPPPPPTPFPFWVFLVAAVGAYVTIRHYNARRRGGGPWSF